MFKILDTWKIKPGTQIELLEMKITMSEINNTLDGINGKLDIVEKILVNLKV